MFQIGSFPLAPDEVLRRKQYLEITPVDEGRLKEARPRLVAQTPVILDRFYEYRRYAGGTPPLQRRGTPPPKGTKVSVRLAAEGGSAVRLSVADDGPGIPIEVQPHLFEPFGASTLRKAGIHVDTGLGLPSCRVMAKAIGADLQVQSDGRRGAVFSVLLPRMQAPAPRGSRIRMRAAGPGIGK